MMLALAALTPQVAVAAGNNGGGGEVGVLADIPITVGAGWSATSTKPPAFFFLEVGSFSDNYTFASLVPVVVRVTDDFCKGDQFEVYDGATLIGTTSAVASEYPGCSPEVGPDAAYADPTYSHGTFGLPAGAHSIKMKAIVSPWGGGRGYIRVDLPVPSITPSTVDEIIFPGGSTVIEKTVVTPAILPLPDIYFLSDTTGSMGPSIAVVQGSAGTILTTIQGLDPTAQFGVGNYKDFPSDPPPVFYHQQAIDGAIPALAAIGTWAAGGGGDGPEAQLFALYKIATDPAIGWRAGSSRIVVWFGDAPGHDPVPAAAAGVNLNEANVTAALVAAGVRVIAVSVTTGYPAGLDDDPNVGGGDYALAYGILEDGTAGQATRIAAATGGVALIGVPPEDVVDAVLEGLSAIEVTVSMASTCTDPITTTFDPTSVTVPSGSVVTFKETISVAADAPGGVYVCRDYVLIDGEPMVNEAGAVIYELKTIRVPEGFLTGGGQIDTGNKPTDNKVSFAGNLGYMADFSLVGQYQMNLHNVTGLGPAPGSANWLDGATFHSTSISELKFFKDGDPGPNPPPANANVAYFIIEGRLNLKGAAGPESGYTLYAYVADRGEPGKAGKGSDSINFALWQGATLIYSSTWDFPANSQVDTIPGPGGVTVTRILSSGNLQIHSGVK